MRSIFGVLMMIGGVFLGLYVGVVVCFVGGIVDILDQMKSANPIESGVVAWGVAKIFLATAAGAISAFVLIVPGFAMVFKGKK